jgi:hypothetical protein
MILAQDRDRWRSVVSAVMNLRVLEPRSESECFSLPSEIISFNDVSQSHWPRGLRRRP